MSKIIRTVQIVAMVAAAFIAGLVVPAVAQQTTVDVDMWGVARLEATGWTLLNNATHQSSGLVMPAQPCLAATGELQINYVTPLVTVGTAAVTPDEAYAGVIEVGPSVGLNAIFISFRDHDGTAISCSSPLLLKSNSNLFVFLRGKMVV